ncbi:hypothetical protein IL38_24565 [Actinopolyspora erythraea]|uniref:Uncharacterized protein n=1 Tax=Actinopolyspora erythraea TaxID=414996 RepID=A0ABR4WY10_9ACTN|nr:hypothetical protein [Actinopolyspora erythraea]KGI79279.1 hypothetical protein IL38_24565 [Actinopolyspora erythraea]
MTATIQTSAPVSTVRIGQKSASLGKRIALRGEAPEGVAVYRIAPASWHGIRDFAVFQGEQVIGFLTKRGTARHADHYRMFCPAQGRACAGTRERMIDAVRDLVAVHEQATS